MNPRYSVLGSRQRSSDIARLMTAAIENPHVLSLAAGFTDNETLPLEGVAEAVTALAAEEQRSILQYGTNQGRIGLREQMVNRLSRSDGRDEYSASQALITNGSQQSLYLAVQTLCDPGDVILVEDPTYFVFLEMLKGLGVEAIAMPMCEDGDVHLDGLREQVHDLRVSGQLGRVKAVYLVSYFANPTGHSISNEGKEGIVELLSEMGGEVALLEDAAYRELYFESPHDAPSALSYPASNSVPIFYSTTLTKSFATGIKVGFGYCNSSDWLSRMLAVKGQQDFGTSHFDQAVLERVFEIGLFDRHLQNLRSLYSSKMGVLHETLKAGLDARDWTWERPNGGLYLWLHSMDGMVTDFDSSFYSACVENGVLYVPGDLCYADRTKRLHLRLSFGVLSKFNLVEAGRRFIRTCTETMVR